MKKLTTAKLFLSVLLAVLSWTAKAQVSDSNIAYLEYKKTMFPLLRKNCAMCHDETAIYPQGPLHSHSEPSSAFSVFNRLAPFNARAEDTKVFKMAGNQHFCKMFDEKCDQADAITTEMQAALRQYLSDTQKAIGASASIKTTVQPERPSGRMEDTTENVVVLQDAIPFDTSFSVATQAGGSNTSYSQTFQLDFPGRFGMLVRWHRMDENYVQVESLQIFSKDYGVWFKAKPVPVQVSGFRVTVNGVDQTAGLAAFDRKSLFLNTQDLVGPKSGTSIALPLRNGIVPVKQGETLEIGLRVAELEAYPSQLCAGHSDAQLMEFFANLGITSVYTADGPLRGLGSISLGEKLNICYSIESQLNLKSPARSVYLNDLMTNERTAVLLGIKQLMSAPRY